jgi:uncharacterized protein with HEPN domain
MALAASDLLAHMREAASQALIYIEGLDREEFLGDKRTQQAVILNLVILGEAATKLMDHHPALAEHHPQIEWRAIRGMRNRIAHGYYDINLDIVWDTLCTALPLLLEQLDRLAE